MSTDDIRKGDRGRSSVLTRYFSAVRRFPLLTKVQEIALAEKICRGCQASQNELIEANLSFVIKVAKQYRNLGLPFEDLVNEGNLGLIEAARRYDAAKGCKFVTYAVWWIRKSILMALADSVRLVRVPGKQLERLKEIREADEALRRSLGRNPDREEISVMIERSMAEVDQVLQLTQRASSLDEMVGSEDGMPLIDRLIDDCSPTTEDGAISRELKESVAEAMTHLSPRERRVVDLRFGITSGTPLTLKEIGDLMKVTKERVRQIEEQALRILNRFFERKLAIRRGSASVEEVAVRTGNGAQPMPKPRPSEEPKPAAASPIPRHAERDDSTFSVAAIDAALSLEIPDF